MALVLVVALLWTQRIFIIARLFPEEISQQTVQQVSIVLTEESSLSDQENLTKDYSYTVIADTVYIRGSTPDQHSIPYVEGDLWLDTLRYGSQVYSREPKGESSFLNITGTNTTTSDPSGRSAFSDYMKLVEQKRSSLPFTTSYDLVPTSKFEEYYKPVFTHPAY